MKTLRAGKLTVKSVQALLRRNKKRKFASHKIKTEKTSHGEMNSMFSIRNNILGFKREEKVVFMPQSFYTECLNDPKMRT